MMSIIEQSESMGFMPSDSIALNEIESNGVLYVRAKPSPEAIQQLRAIKKLRFNDKIETADKVTETLLTTDLKDLGTTKGEERKLIEQRITKKLLLFFKNSHGFSKSDLNALIPREERTRERLTKKLILNMKLMGKVKEVKVKAKYLRLVNRNQGSNDFGSYALLLKSKNGCVLDSPLSVCRKTETYEKSFYEID